MEDRYTNDDKETVNEESHLLQEHDGSRYDSNHADDNNDDDPTTINNDFDVETSHHHRINSDWEEPPNNTTGTKNTTITTSTHPPNDTPAFNAFNTYYGGEYYDFNFNRNNTSIQNIQNSNILPPYNHRRKQQASSNSNTIQPNTHTTILSSTPPTTAYPTMMLSSTPPNYTTHLQQPTLPFQQQPIIPNNNTNHRPTKVKKTVTRGRKDVGAFRRKRQDYDNWKGRVGVHLEVDAFDLKLLSEGILDDLPGWELMDHYDVIRLWLPFEEGALSGGEEGNNFGALVDASTPEIYIFSFGAVVFWNFPDESIEQSWLTKHLWNFQNNDAIGERHPSSASENASDQVSFCYGDVFKVHRDVVQLKSRESGEKLAVSFAIAKSSHLSIFEWRLDQAVERNAHLPEQLAKTGHIQMSSAEISMEIGRIYMVKNQINLESTILDTPEEFWEDDKFQEEYTKALTYFDINSRLTLVNNRLDVMQDMNQILIDAVQTHHATLLEYTVIWLIIAEVVIELFRSYRDGF